MFRWYSAMHTHDALDRQKMREFQRSYTQYSYWNNIANILLACLAAGTACLIPAVIAAGLPIVGYPLICILFPYVAIRVLSRDSINKRKESNIEGYRQWMLWKDLREDAYYGGGSTVNHVIDNCLVVLSAVNNMQDFAECQNGDIWTCDINKMPWIDPLRFLKETEDGYYDYTALLEELAYYTMVYCSRIKHRATLVSFVEYTAFRLIGGSDPSIRSEASHHYYIQPQHPLTEAFPMKPTQRESLKEFNYNTYDSAAEGQWLKQVWQNAANRYLETLQGEDYVINLPQSYVDKIKSRCYGNIDYYLQKSQPPVTLHGKHKKTYQKMNEIPWWDEYFR